MSTHNHRKLARRLEQQDHRIPRCSECGGKLQHNADSEWFCLRCADSWLHEYAHNKGRSVGGVQLPAGVRDERVKLVSFRQLVPNRATRRALA